MENFKIGEAGKTLGTHYVEAMEMLEAQKAAETPVATQEEVKEQPKSGKWYDQEGAFPYQEGDIAIITNINKHKGLIGRKVQIVKPSAKKNAVKAFLLNSKTGELQGTMITLMFDYIELYKEEEVKEETEVTA